MSESYETAHKSKTVTFSLIRTKIKTFFDDTCHYHAFRLYLNIAGYL